MKNPPRSLLRAIRKAAYGSDHVNHGARHGGIAPDPNVYAPLVPAAISHGGINKDDYDNGLITVLVEPYVGMAVNDIIDLYWDDSYIDYATVTDATATQALIADAYYISPDALEATLHYHVKDPAGNERASQSLVVPIKLNVPGNPPEPPDPPILHSTPISGCPMACRTSSPTSAWWATWR